MLRDLAVESGFLAGLGFCVFWFVPFLMYPSRSSHPIGELVGFFSFIGFILLLYFSARHLKRLLGEGKTKHVVAFTLIIVATVAISIVLTWMLHQPIPIDPNPFMANL